MQNFTTIGCTVAKISVVEQTERITPNLVSDKRILVLRLPEQCLWRCHYGKAKAVVRVHPVHLMNVEQRQVAATFRLRQPTWP